MVYNIRWRVHGMKVLAAALRNAKDYFNMADHINRNLKGSQDSGFADLTLFQF